MDNGSTVRIGVAGLGGYGRAVRETIGRCAEADALNGVAPIALHSVCDIAPAAFPELVRDLEGRGVGIFDDYHRMLEAPVDAVWLPVPIHLHLPFTEAALAAGKRVVCEKPIAGTIDEVDAMIRARDAAGLGVQIAFQHMFDRSTPIIRQRIAEGLIGPVRRASLWACWPRPEAYYQRNDWAGALQRGGVWVLDSPAQNAMAHYVQLMLHFLGGEPRNVEAELYRTRPIENFDTCSMRLGFEGFQAVVLLTHASANHRGPFIAIEGERGRLDWSFEGAAFTDPSGRELERFDADSEVRVNVARRLVADVRGEPAPFGVGCPIEAARPHTLVIDAAAEVAEVHTLPESAYELLDNGTRALHGIDDAFEHCAAWGEMLHESGMAPWAQAGGSIETAGYTNFNGPLAAR